MAKTTVDSSKLYMLYLLLMKVGIGMSMEGIEQNPVVYDLMSEMAFQHEKIDMKVTFFHL